MKPVSYQDSIRVKKARFASYFGRTAIKIIIILGWLLIVTGIVLFFAVQMSPASLLVSLGIIMVMFGVWLRWDLGTIHAIYNPDSAEIPLDYVVTKDIVYLINDKQSPRRILASIVGNWQVAFICTRYELDPRQLAGMLSDDVAQSQALWNRAFVIAGQVPIREISAGVLLVAMMMENQLVEDWLHQNSLDIQDMVGGLMWEESLWKRVVQPKQKSRYGGVGRDWASGYTPILDKYGQNISMAIIDGNRDFSGVRRGHVLEQMYTNMNKADRNNLALVGEVGVGKTALVYAMAERLMEAGKNVPDALRYKQVVQIDPGVVAAAVNQNVNIELIFGEIIKNATRAGNIILYFDEAQLFFGSEAGTVDVAGILLPALQSSQIRLITSFSLDDWHKLSSSNPSLAGHFARVDIEPTDREQTIDILQDISIQLESKAKSIVTFKALQAAYDMADRYLRSKAMPAKAIDLLSDSMNYPIDGRITEASVARATEIITNTKVSEARGVEKQQLLNLEELIHQRMINQSRAVKVVSDALRRSRAGVRNPNRPVGSFLFLGPTGVGKTELTKALAAVYFGSEDTINRLDMSEYQNKSDINRLLEPASKDQRGSAFLQKVNQNPFSVILFDEIEKAHPDILNLLLQILDEGILTDSAGHKISFKEAIIICTSNAGANEIRAQIEAGHQLEEFEDQLTDQLINQNIFRPELINRYDDVVLFRPLNKEELLEVAKLIIAGVNKTLASRKVSIELTPQAMQYLVELGYDPRLGARPMRRVTSRLVENLIANKLLSGELKPGGKLMLDVADLQGVG